MSVYRSTVENNCTAIEVKEYCGVSVPKQVKLKGCPLGNTDFMALEDILHKYSC